MRDLILGAAVCLIAWGAILLMIAGGFRIAANARIEEERRRARAELIRRANRIAEARAREIVRHAQFSVRIVTVNESDISWGEKPCSADSRSR